VVVVVHSVGYGHAHVGWAPEWWRWFGHLLGGDWVCHHGDGQCDMCHQCPCRCGDVGTWRCRVDLWAQGVERQGWCWGLTWLWAPPLLLSLLLLLPHFLSPFPILLKERRACGGAVGVRGESDGGWVCGLEEGFGVVHLMGLS
jgi:hypothetical protein